MSALGLGLLAAVAPAEAQVAPGPLSRALVTQPGDLALTAGSRQSPDPVG